MAAGHGRIAALGCDLAPDAPEKVLAVSGRLDDALLPLVRAVARAGQWCADPANRTDLIHCLAHRTYLDLDVELVARGFAGDAMLDAVGATRPMPSRLDLGAAVQEPRPEAARWLVAQMAAAQQIPDRRTIGVREIRAVTGQGVEAWGQDITFGLEARDLLGTEFVEYQELGDSRIDRNRYKLGRSISLSLSARF